MQCRPLRGLRWNWPHYGPGAHATRLLQCRPLRGLRFVLGVTPPGYRNVARSAGCVSSWGSRHQATAMSPAPRAAFRPGGHATRLLQCRPLRGLRFVLGAHAQARLCNVARSAGCVSSWGSRHQATAMSPAPRAAFRPGAHATRLLQCRPLRGLPWLWSHYGPGAHATRLLQCHPLRGLRWHWATAGGAANMPDRIIRSLKGTFFTARFQSIRRGSVREWRSRGRAAWP